MSMARVDMARKKPFVTAARLRALTVIISMVVLMSFTQARADELYPAAPPDTGPVAGDQPTASLYVDILSQYIFRGVAYSADSVVMQPSATVGYKGLSLAVWGNFDTNEKLYSGHARWNETDLTLSYSREIVKNLNGTVGYIFYALPNAPEDSNEFFFGLSYTLPWLTVGVTAYREFHAYPGWWMQIDLSRNFKLPWYDMSVDVGASFGYLDSSPQDFADFHSGTLLAALNIPINKYITISPRVGFAFPLTGDGEDNISANSWDGQGSHVFGGIRLVASF
jgi:hypothetical protein